MGGSVAVMSNWLVGPVMMSHVQTICFTAFKYCRSA